MLQATNLLEEEVSLVLPIELEFQRWVPLPSRHPNLCKKICIKYSKHAWSFFSSTIDFRSLVYHDPKKWILKPFSHLHFWSCPWKHKKPSKVGCFWQYKLLMFPICTWYKYLCSSLWLHTRSFLLLHWQNRNIPPQYQSNCQDTCKIYLHLIYRRFGIKRILIFVKIWLE